MFIDVRKVINIVTVDRFKFNERIDEIKIHAYMVANVKYSDDRKLKYQKAKNMLQMLVCACVYVCAKYPQIFNSWNICVCGCLHIYVARDFPKWGRSTHIYALADHRRRMYQRAQQARWQVNIRLSRTKRVFQAQFMIFAFRFIQEIPSIGFLKPRPRKLSVINMKI